MIWMKIKNFIDLMAIGMVTEHARIASGSNM